MDICFVVSFLSHQSSHLSCLLNRVKPSSLLHGPVGLWIITPSLHTYASFTSMHGPVGLLIPTSVSIYLCIFWVSMYMYVHRKAWPSVRLEHPHILRLEHVVVEGSDMHLVMDLCSGGDLQAWTLGSLTGSYRRYTAIYRRIRIWDDAITQNGITITLSPANRSIMTFRHRPSSHMLQV